LATSAAQIHALELTVENWSGSNVLVAASSATPQWNWVFPQGRSVMSVALGGSTGGVLGIAGTMGSTNLSIASDEDMAYLVSVSVTDARVYEGHKRSTVFLWGFYLVGLWGGILWMYRFLHSIPAATTEI